MKRIILDKYEVMKRIGSGSFGQVYQCMDQTTKDYFAAKVEKINVSVPQLSFEANMYKMMNGFTHVGRYENFSKEKNYKALIFELLGKSLETNVAIYGKLSLKTVLMLANSMINSIEYIHKKHFIHRDIKPENFMMGKKENRNKMYVIDFGLSKKYQRTNNLEHIAFKTGKKLTGTIRYASLNALLGQEQSRRDDMESLGYVLIFLLKGHLPWMGVKSHSHEDKYRKIVEIKKKITFEELCTGLPVEFLNYFTEIRKLSFSEEPKYAEYRKMFRELFIHQNYIFDEHFEWSLQKQQIVMARQLKHLKELQKLKNSHLNKQYKFIKNNLSLMTPLSSSLNIISLSHKGDDINDADDHNYAEKNRNDRITHNEENDNNDNNNNGEFVIENRINKKDILEEIEQKHDSSKNSLDEFNAKLNLKGKMGDTYLSRSKNIHQKQRRSTKELFRSRSGSELCRSLHFSTTATAQSSNLDDLSSNFESQLDVMNDLLNDLTKENSSSGSSGSYSPSKDQNGNQKVKLKIMNYEKVTTNNVEKSKIEKIPTDSSSETDDSAQLDSILVSMSKQKNLLDSLLDVE